MLTPLEKQRFLKETGRTSKAMICSGYTLLRLVDQRRIRCRYSSRTVEFRDRPWQKKGGRHNSLLCHLAIKVIFSSKRGWHFSRSDSCCRWEVDPVMPQHFGASLWRGTVAWWEEYLCQGRPEIFWSVGHKDEGYTQLESLAPQSMICFSIWEMMIISFFWSKWVRKKAWAHWSFWAFVAIPKSLYIRYVYIYIHTCIYTHTCRSICVYIFTQYTHVIYTYTFCGTNFSSTQILIWFAALAEVAQNSKMLLASYQSPSEGLVIFPHWQMNSLFNQGEVNVFH